MEEQVTPKQEHIQFLSFDWKLPATSDVWLHIWSKALVTVSSTLLGLDGHH